MEGLKHPIFDGQIDTNNLSIEQVVELIAKKLNIGLLNDKRSNIKKGWTAL